MQMFNIEIFWLILRGSFPRITLFSMIRLRIIFSCSLERTRIVIVTRSLGLVKGMIFSFSTHTM